MGKGRSHGSVKLSEAMVVGIDKVKREWPLDRTTASSWGGAYKTEHNIRHSTAATSFCCFVIFVPNWIGEVSMPTCAADAVRCWRSDCGLGLSDRHWGQPTGPVHPEDPLFSPWFRIVGQHSLPRHQDKAAPEAANSWRRTSFIISVCKRY